MVFSCLVVPDGFGYSTALVFERVRYCFNLGPFLTWGLYMYSGVFMCDLFVRRDDKNKTKKTRREKKKGKNHVSSARAQNALIKIWASELARVARA